MDSKFNANDELNDSKFCVDVYEYFVEKINEGIVDPSKIYYAIGFEEHVGVTYIRGKCLYIRNNSYVSSGFSGCFAADEITKAKLSGKYAININI